MSHIRKVAYISITPSRKVVQLVLYERLTSTHLNPQNFKLIFFKKICSTFASDKESVADKPPETCRQTGSFLPTNW